jgi:hypothetical protein
VVRCYPCCTIWPGKAMANLSLPRQPIKICSFQALRTCRISHCLPPYHESLFSFETNCTKLAVWQLLDHIQDFICKLVTGATDPLMAHCRGESFHEVWKVLLDKDFIHAYLYGVVMDCADGIKWWIYPCIFTYSADDNLTEFGYLL